MSNAEWESPADAEARVAKIVGGRSIPTGFSQVIPAVGGRDFPDYL